MRQLLLSLLLILSFAGYSLAEDHPVAHEATAAHEVGAAHAQAAHDIPHPALSSDSSWASPMLVGVLVMFGAAWVVGEFVQLVMPPTHSTVELHHEVEDSHDDHGHGHGHDHGHGHAPAHH